MLRNWSAIDFEESPTLKEESSNSSETKENLGTNRSNALSTDKSMKKIAYKSKKSRQTGFLSRSVKKNIPKSKRNNSERKRLLTVTKMNSDKISRKSTTHSTYKNEWKDKSSGSLLPPINKIVKWQSSNSSKNSFNSNFASDIKKKMSREFVFTHQKTMLKPIPKHRRQAEVMQEYPKVHGNRSPVKPVVLKRLSDPLEIKNTEYLRNFDLSVKNRCNKWYDTEWTCIKPLQLYR